MRTHQQRQKRARRLLFEPLEQRHLLALLAANDSYVLNEDAALTVHIDEGVLKNDVSDYPLTARVIDGPARGVLAFGPGGSFIYVPSRDFHGLDSFTYQATDSVNLSNIATVTFSVQPVNDPPLAVNDSYPGPFSGPFEDISFAVSAANGLLKNDLDPDGQPLTVSLPSVSAVTGSGNNTNFGAVVVSPDGRFTYSPGANFFGTVSFTYRISDGIVESLSPATVTITVQPLNDAPVAVGDSYSTHEELPLVVPPPGILANDTDIEGDPLTVQLVSPPLRGTLLPSPFGSFTYFPNPNFYGVDSFTYRASDGMQFSSFLAVVTITVLPVNDGPFANNDGIYTVSEDSTLTVTASSGLLANDSDPDNYAPVFPNAGLTAALVLQPLHGTVTVNPNGSFTYVPNANYFSPLGQPEFFTYRATDQAGFSSTATVTINVQAVNDVPVGNHDVYNVLRNNTLSVSAANGVLRNDSDIDGDPLTAVDIVLPVGNGTPTMGTLTVNANGSFTYIAPANTTQVSFTYRASDGQFKSNPVTVWINVGGGPPPTAVNDSYPAIEDTALTIAAPGVLANDTDAPGFALTAIQPTQPAHGTVVLNPSGSFTYTPSANFFGPDSFTYRPTDGEVIGNPATVTINVQSVNDTPVASNGSAPPFFEDQTLTVTAPGLLVHVTDIDSLHSNITAAIVANAAHGVVTLSPSGSYTYVPDINYFGPDSFTYRVSDGEALSNTGTITINVAPVNDLPFAANDTYPSAGVPVVQEDTALTVSAANGLLRNDTDVDGQALFVVLASVTQTLPAASGIVVMSQNGSFIFTPAANFFGAASFTYVATDTVGNGNTAVVTLNVAPVADIPIANSDAGYSTNEDTTLTTTISILANDTDTDNPTPPQNAGLTAQLVSAPAHGLLSLNANGQFTYTPFANLSGVISFTYRASDGANQSNLATVTITVQPVNDTPVAVSDNYVARNDRALSIAAAQGVLVNDTDADGDTLIVVQFTQPSDGSLTVSSSGAFTYTPPNNFVGFVSFTYRATDGQLTSNPATVTIRVSTPPQTFPPRNDTYSATEDTILTKSASEGVLANDGPFDPGPVTAVQFTQPLHGAVIGNPDGSFTYTPATHFFGTDIFTYVVTDGLLVSGPATVTINVQAANDPPLVLNDFYMVSEDSSLAIPANLGVLVNDFDPDGDSLFAMKVSDPARGTMFLAANGSFTYVPNLNFAGLDSFTYRASDGLASNLATVTIQVVDSQPIFFANDDSYNLPEDATLTISAPGVLGNDRDPDSTATLTAEKLTNPAHGTATLNANGGLTYIPAANFNGTDSFTYKATYDFGLSGTAIVTINVTAVNDPPVATGDVYVAVEDAALTIAAPGLLINDFDPDDTALTAVQVTDPAHGTLVKNSNGSFIYLPSSSFSAAASEIPPPNPRISYVDSFTYRAFDGTFLSNLATVIVSVFEAIPPLIALDDHYGGQEDTTLLISPALGVLANESDPDLEPGTLVAIPVAGPTQGSLTLNASGGFSYAPNPNFHGTDSFTYRSSDGTHLSNVATVMITIQPVNDPPSFGKGSELNVTDEMPPQSITAWAKAISAGPPDEAGQTLAFSVTNDNNDLFSAQPTIDPSGKLTFDPKPNASGTATVTVLLKDNGGTENGGSDTSAPQIFTITITKPYPLHNTARHLDTDDDTFISPLDALLIINYLNSLRAGAPPPEFFYHDTSRDNQVSPLDALLIINRLNALQAGEGESGIAAADPVTVQAANSPPIATNDGSAPYITPQNTVLTISAPGVLGNDVEPDNDPLTIIQATSPSHGTLSLTPLGGFTYTPAPRYHGADSFTYRLIDGSLFSNFATVTISISPSSAPPFAVDDRFTVAKNGTLLVSAPGILLNDDSRDPVTAGLITGHLNGLLQLSPSGGFIYTPAAGYCGQDSFTYRMNDGVESNLATVTINVSASGNHPPIAANGSFTTPEDVGVTLPLLGSNADPDGDTLHVVVASGPTFGALTPVGIREFFYAPALHFTGIDSFTYRISDGPSLSNTATVTISVTRANDAPVAFNEKFTYPRNGTLSISPPGILANDLDFDLDSLTAVLVEGVGAGKGTLTLNANGSFVYAPPTNFSDAVSFTYQANDPAGPSSNTATVTLSNFPFPPDLVTPDSFTILEDVTLTIPAPGVLANDIDLNGDSLTAVKVSDPLHGSLVLNANGSFLYRPDRDFHGIDLFTYKGFDGQSFSDTATVTLTVQPVNDPPVAVNDSYTTNEDTTLTVAGANGLLKNDFDADFPAGIVATHLTSPSRGYVVLNADGSFRYAPGSQLHGIDSFTYRVTDGQAVSNTATVTINVTPVNDLPQAYNDSFNVAQNGTLSIPVPGILGNDLDVDGDTLTVNNAAAINGNSLNGDYGAIGQHGTLTASGDGSFTYVAPNSPQLTRVSFTYRATDGRGGLSDTALVRINLRFGSQANNPPVASTDTGYSVNEDIALTVQPIGVLGNDQDVDGDSLIAVQFSQPSAAHGTVAGTSQGGFVFTPAANFFGPTSFTYRASDGQSVSNPATVFIAVSGDDEPPLAFSDGPYTVIRSDSPITVTASLGVLRNDSDPDGDQLTAVLVSQPSKGTVNLNPDGGFTYTPNTSGYDSFTYKAFDGGLSSNVATVLIQPYQPPDAPVANNDLFAAAAWYTLTVSSPGILANDSDPDGETLAAVKVDGPTSGTLTLNSNGSFTYAPLTGFYGIDSFTYRASDGLNFSNTATVIVAVTDHGGPPIARDDTGYSIPEDGTLSVNAAAGVLINDIDDNTRPLFVFQSTQPARGAVALNPDGSFAYTPTANSSGADSFTYSVSNGDSSSNSATVTITVEPLNDPPTFTRGPDLSANDESPPQSIPGWAKNIAAGPQDEAGQTLAFTTTNDNNDLFTAQPAIDPSGKLTFDPKPNASGTATVTVVLKDDGGTANGGSDTSAPQTFTITVTKPRPLHNTARPFDTDDNAEIAPLDALHIINYLTSFRPSGPPPSLGHFYYDTSRDNDVSPFDALLIINYLNALQAGEGESTLPSSAEDRSDDRKGAADLLALLAADLAGQPKRRRGM